LRKSGVPNQKIISVGPLARPTFYTYAKNNIRGINKEKLKMKLGISPQTTIALVTAGFAWINRSKEYMDYLRHAFMNDDIKFIFVCGKNSKFQKEMSVKYKGCPSFIFLPWLLEEEMAEWMCAADFLLAFTLAQTSVEAGLAHLPIIIFRLISGQEDGFRDVIENRGVGMYLPGTPQNQVSMLKLVYPYLIHAYDHRLDVWQKDLLNNPEKIRNIIQRLTND
jgi:hypothetical protein